MPRLLAALLSVTLLAFSIPAQATILWSQPGTTLVNNTGKGEDILHGAIKPQDTNSSSTLYFRLRVDPTADSVIKAIGDFEAGFVLTEKGEEHLGVGNAFGAWAYCAWPMPKTAKGYVDFNSANPDPGKSWEYMRAGVPRYIAFKVEFIPGHDARVTAWLNPDLSTGATEINQPTNIVTHFEANATFDEIHLVFRGEFKGGWKFSQMVAGTSFEDLLIPHFWQRRWFIVVTGAGLLLAVAGIVQLFERRRARGQIQRLERENAVAAERGRIARDIHDELGASLTKIHKLAEMLGQPGGPPDNMGGLPKIISNAARDTIRSLDEIVWAINPQNDTLSEMADYLVYYTEDFLRSTGITCVLDVPLKLPDIPVVAEVRHNLFMVVKEALNNDVKHAAAGQIRFGLDFSANLLTVEIHDNGRGFSPDKIKPSGNGLENMRRRLAAIGGQLSVQSEPGQGATVKLQVAFPEITVK